MRSCAATIRSSRGSSWSFPPPMCWSTCSLTSATPSSIRASAIRTGATMTVVSSDLVALAAPSVRGRGAWAYIRRHPTIVIGGTLLGLMALMAIFAPYLGTVDPQALSPIRRLRWPSAQYWFGTDMLGRDVYSRTVYGARVSLIVGVSVALLATTIGLLIGVVAGFTRWVDTIVMRVMDGLMSIPSILIAIALMALTRASLEN